MSLIWCSRIFVLTFVVAIFDGSDARASERLHIAVITPENQNKFWLEVGEGATAAGRENGVRVSFRGPASEDDRLAQKLIIEQAITQKVNALVIAPNDPDRAIEVEKAKKLGIPTIYIDRNFGNAPIAAFIGTNNYEAGKVAAQTAFGFKPTNHKFAVFGLQKGVVSTDQREEGFKNLALEQNFELVGHYYLGTEFGSAFRTAQELLKHSPELGVVFAPNEFTTRAIVQALKNWRGARPLLIGFDSSPELLAALEKGEVAALIAQQPFEMGKKAVELALMALKGEIRQQNWNLPVSVMTKNGP